MPELKRSEIPKTEGLKPLETCPNGHRYNAWKYGDTCKVCGAKIEIPEKEQTPQEEEQAKEIQMQNRVVGWLVCVKGPNQGVDYRLKAGKNFIGSDPNMDVYVKGDRKIDRRNHAVVMYDGKTRKTMLIPGESQGMVYYDNEAIYVPTPISTLKEIEMGDSIFYYAPFCTGQLDWMDLDKKNRERGC